MGPQQLVGGYDEFSRVARTGLADCSVLTVNHYVWVGVDGIGDDDLTLNRRIGRSGPNRYSIRWLRFHQSLPVSMGTCSDDLKWNSHLPGFRFVLVGMETNRAIAVLLGKNEDRQMRFRK
jgi:hypothetical protein